MSSDAPVNAAVEWIRRLHRSVNALERFPADSRVPVTDDFTFEDRRSGGMNFGLIERSVVFDVTATDAAVDQLDRMHSELTG